VSLSAQPIAEMSGAYQQSLGGISSTMTGVHAVFANPAGIATADSFGLEVAYANPFSLTGYQRVVGGVVLPLQTAGVFAVSARQERVASLSNSVVSLSYARRLSDKLRLGIQADWVQLAIDGFGSTSAILPEIGIQYDAIEQVTLSAHIIAPGEIALIDDQPIPSQLELGMLYQPSRKVDCHVAMRKVVDRPAEIIGAIDYRVHDRLGIHLGANAGTGSVSAGASIGLLSGLQLHCAFVYHERLGATPAVGGQWLP
jgi:hypothetical protein